MSDTPRRGRVSGAWRLAIPVLALGAIALAPIAGGAAARGGPASGAAPPAASAWTPLTPVTVSYSHSTQRTRAVHLLSFNDLHGNIDPPTGSGGLVAGNPAGGVEYLATTVKTLRRQAAEQGADSLTVAAGDLIGASPLISAAFHDEPTIELMNALGLDMSSVGNHEFDEGVAELTRIQRGGCHPVDGCQDGDPYAGADFPYLAANVVDKRTHLPILPPFQVRTVNGVKVGFVGLTLKGTPTIVNPAGVTTVDFLDEVRTANFYADLLTRVFKVRSLVLLIHQGGSQGTTPPPTVDGCAGFAGDITPIVAGLRPEYGVVVSGHTHRFYSCALPNSSGQSSVVTSAGAFGVLVTDIAATLDRGTGRFATISAHNVIVENGIRNPDGTWQKDANGNFVRNPDTVDHAAKAIADKYRAKILPIANRVVGTITADITNTNNPAGESAMGDVIADAQLAYTATSAQAQIALMNPGGIRTSLTYASSPGGEAPGQVTYGECFAVQPFNNLVVTQTFTGAQLKNVLEQQFAGFGGQGTTRILQVSASLTYSYNTTLPLGSRVSNLALNGTPIDPAASYRVTTNDFLANGGDGFTNLTAGTNRVTAPGFDVDALTAYLGSPAQPVAPGPQNRITMLA
ncbi:MAG TPA: bifunctional metallophosphatase/5'-nucleotidase [Mycobacteriales bacterium]|nr:bifunctional metallophosphatase/5'-nucleotidase [Mycobacteriales bacterium]